MTASVLAAVTTTSPASRSVERSPLARIAGDWRLPALVVLAAVFIGEASLRSDHLGEAAVVIVIFAAFVLAWPTLGVLVMVAVAPVSSGTERGHYVPHLRLSEAIIFGTAALVLTTAGHRAHSKWRIVDWLSLTYVAATLTLGLIDTQIRNQPIDAQAYSTLLQPVEFLLLYRTVVVALPTPALRRQAVRVLLITSVPVSILAIAQWRGSLTVENWLYRFSGSQGVLDGFSVHRATGPFDKWHPLAGYLFLLIMLSVALLFHEGQRVLRRRWLAAIVVVDACALVATLTIVAILGTVVGVAVIAIRTRHVRQVLIGLAVVGVVAGVLARPAIEERLNHQFYSPAIGSTVNPRHTYLPQTVSYRIDVWQHQYVPAIKDRLVSGYGPGIPPGVTWSSTESVYVGLLLRGGIPLLAVYLFWLAAVYQRGRRAEHASQAAEIRALGMTLTTVVPVMTVMQTIEPYFINSGFPHVLWLFVAVSAVADLPRRRWAVAPVASMARPALATG